MPYKQRKVSCITVSLSMLEWEMKQLVYGGIRNAITFVTRTFVVCAYTSNGGRDYFYLGHLFHYG